VRLSSQNVNDIIIRQAKMGRCMSYRNPFTDLLGR
jgi:hypothetical protein